MRILVLGAASQIGRAVCAELAENIQVNEVVVADTDKRTADAIAQELGDSAVPGHLDGLEGPALTKALESADAAVACMFPSWPHDQTVVSSAISAGTPVVTFTAQYSAATAALALDEAARRAGVSVLIGAGASPGLSGILVSIASQHVSTAVEAKIALHHARNGYHHFYQAPGPSKDVYVRQGGQIVNLLHGSGIEDVFFPEPVGWSRVALAAHAEPELLARGMPELESIAVSSSAGSLASAQTIGAGASPRARQIVDSLLGRVSGLASRVAPQSSWSALRVDVRGSAPGGSRTIALGAVDRELTMQAVPAAVAVVALARGEAPAGIHGTQVLDPVSFLKHCEARGMRFARLEAN